MNWIPSFGGDSSDSISWYCQFTLLGFLNPANNNKPTEGNPSSAASALHLEETVFGVAPHLCSLKGRENNYTTAGVTRSSSQSRPAAPYLFAHADLHDSIIDERFSQVFVFLLLEALHVHPRPVNVLSNTHNWKWSLEMRLYKVFCHSNCN